ncbi:MAG: phosphatidate cytidylyltransferase [Clostridium sp.]|nr:phosphatidate cytidylyltransferase [Clostridium sp.]
MTSIIKRALTGTVYVAAIVLSLLFTDWLFPALMLLFVIFGLLEYARLVDSENKLRFSLSTAFDIFFALILVLPPVFRSEHYVFIAMAALLVYFPLRFVLQLFLPATDKPLSDVGRSFVSIWWIVIPLFMLQLLMPMIESGIRMRQTLLVMFIMIWLNDTGAYCFGSRFGRHRLFERISPKKSWEGFWGGLFVTALFGYFAPMLFVHIPMGSWRGLVFGILVSVVATLGDLVESMFKRALHVKDSGNILPGHGGILDRVDSLLFVAPMTFWFIVLTGIIR